MSEKKTKTTYTGWHWLPADGMTVSYGGAERQKVRSGRTMRVKGTIVACHRGLHASKRPIDALRFIKGTLIQRVTLSGTIAKQGDKAAASHRTCVWMADATQVLKRFVLEWAEQIVKYKGLANEHTEAAFGQARELLCERTSKRSMAAVMFRENMERGLNHIGTCLRRELCNLGSLVHAFDFEKLKVTCGVFFQDTYSASLRLLNKRLSRMLCGLRPRKKAKK